MDTIPEGSNGLCSPHVTGVQAPATVDIRVFPSQTLAQQTSIAYLRGSGGPYGLHPAAIAIPGSIVVNLLRGRSGDSGIRTESLPEVKGAEIRSPAPGSDPPSPGWPPTAARTGDGCRQRIAWHHHDVVRTVDGNDSDRHAGGLELFRVAHTTGQSSFMELSGQASWNPERFGSRRESFNLSAKVLCRIEAGDRRSGNVGEPGEIEPWNPPLVREHDDGNA